MNLPCRRLAQAAEWSLLAIVVLLHVAGWVWRERIADAGPLAALLADSLPLASILLLSLWLALGPGSPWIRGGAAALLVAIVAVSTDTDSFNRWAPADWLLGMVPLATFACAAIMRLCGLKVLSCQLDREPSRGATFTVRSLLAITTAIAVVVGGLEAVRPWLRIRMLPAISDAELDVILGPVTPPAALSVTLTQNQPSVVTLPASAPWQLVVRQLETAQSKGQLRTFLACFLLIAISLLTCAAMLQPDAIWLRIAGLTLLIPAAGWYIGHLTETDPEATLTLTIWAGTTVALLAGSLMPLRLLGYRLTRSRAIAADSPPRFQRLPRFTSDRDHLVSNHAVRPTTEVHS